jgi:hypothetical protein
MGQHITDLIVKSPFIINAVKKAVFTAPVKPGKSQTMKNLPGVVFRPVLGQIIPRVLPCRA